MTLAICIPTFNRKQLVEVNARSLRKAHIPKTTKIIVVDDASTEFDVDWLKSIYPKSTQVVRRSQNSGGASFSVFDAMTRLVATEANSLFLLDSDFIVNPNFVELALHELDNSDGMLSLFNTPNHPAIGELGDLLLKNSVGCAATLWTRECAMDVLNHVAIGDGWDWRFCEYFAQKSKRVFCVKRSLAQHLGVFEGQNLVSNGGDIGVGFDAEGNEKDYLIFLEQAILGQQAALSKLEFRVRRLERSFLERFQSAGRKFFKRISKPLVEDGFVKK